jgi:hypothetical protein
MEGARYLEDGRLTIFKRSGLYYARLRTSSSTKYLWRSLKTSNEETAVQLGRRLLFQLEQRADQGLPPKSKLFDEVIDDYIPSQTKKGVTITALSLGEKLVSVMSSCARVPLRE